MFEKKYEGITYSRFAASWRKACDLCRVRSYYGDMLDWLKSLTINGKKMDDRTAEAIAAYTHDGKLELETNAIIWLKWSKNED